ncbi:hypothetical protein [Tersicoccus sp. Bi-70]|uniref:hypothetical protein n=1 Tax=Tersicoccus sp. Bi-70 TaxID=1897634 RepID=UPI00117D51B3|nr:hypothetical protein [Tersicoccus sp. Bi-70]
MISKLTTPGGGKVTPVPASKVRQAASATNAAAKSAEVTPAACRALTLKASSIPDDAGVGIGTASGGKVMVSVILGKDGADLKSRVSDARQLLSTCAKVTLKTAKGTTQQTLSQLSAPKVGDDSVAVLNTQSSSGITVTLTQISAVKGKRLATITAVGKPSNASDLALLAQLAKKALDTPATGGGATA